MSIFNNATDHPFPLYIDSSERISGRNGAFQSAPAILSSGNKYDSVVVNQISIPKSWYNTPSQYSTFTLSEFDGVITTQTTITLPAGNYNRITLAAVLPPLLNAASVLGKTFTMTYPNVSTQADTGLYSFAYTPVIPGESISFIFSNAMFQQLGFDINSTNTFDLLAGTLDSTNVINFQTISSIFILSDMCVEEGTLQELHSVGSSPSNSYIYFQQSNFDLPTKQLLTNTSNSWNFTLIDQNEREVFLNGCPWQMSVFLYNRSDLHQLQKEDLRIKNLERIVENELKLKS